MFGSNNENLISIDGIISLAKERGVDFGKGNPRNRLRYYTKIGLLPNARRKSFNGKNSQGTYPEEVVDLLVEIDKKLKAGKTVQFIKKEREKREAEEIFQEKVKPVLEPSPKGLSLEDTYKEKISERKILETIQSAKDLRPQAARTEVLDEEIEPEFRKTEKNPPKKTLALLKTVFTILILGSLITSLGAYAVKKDVPSYLLASLSQVSRLAENNISLPAGSGPSSENFNFLASEPYLTINAGTEINAPLKVKESIITPLLNLTSGEFKGVLNADNLSDDRNYTFPDQSGVVCLTTGNCAFTANTQGVIVSSGAIPNRLTKFINGQTIGASSISDIYRSGLAISINQLGNVGIGTVSPKTKLEVGGKITATGDICTDLNGGRCLSKIRSGGGGGVVYTGSELSGSGAGNYLSLWTGGTSLGNSVIYQDGSNVGIGTTSPSQMLDVGGTIKGLGFQMPTGAHDNYVLTADTSGFGTWKALSTSTLPIGNDGQTLRYHSGWVASYLLYNNENAIGIGTTSTPATLTLSGNAIFSTTTLPQFSLKYDNNNYLNFSISDTQSLLESSKTLVINSLTGEVGMGSNVTLFNATGTTISADTFLANDSTVRKSGEMVLRGVVPIFRYPIPSQSSSINFIRISKYFSTSTSIASMFPSSLPGTTRKYAFLINLADDIPTNSSSAWRVYRQDAGTEYFSFEITGQALSSLEEGKPHLTSFYTLPDNDWQLEVKASSAGDMRIFNIFLLAYDEV